MGLDVRREHQQAPPTAIRLEVHTGDKAIAEQEW
jgi:hypothetical protein